MLFDVGRASGTKLCRLLWNTNLVEIELSSLCLPWKLEIIGELKKGKSLRCVSGLYDVPKSTVVSHSQTL